MADQPHAWEHDEKLTSKINQSTGQILEPFVIPILEGELTRLIGMTKNRSAVVFLLGMQSIQVHPGDEWVLEALKEFRAEGS